MALKNKASMPSPALIDLPKIADPRGNLTFAQTPDHVPFDIARAYWLYDVPADAERGGHGHVSLQQLIVALGGSFTVNLFDGYRWKKVLLNRPYKALYIPSGIWRTLDDFTSGSVCLVLASEPYSEDEYIRDFDKFKEFAANFEPRL